jgi:Domain of unknown function (DUF4129)
VTSRRTLVTGAVLGVVVVVAAGSQGSAQFTGLRWVPDWDASPATVPPRAEPPLATPSPLPSGAAGPSGGTDLFRILLWVAIGAAAVVAALLLWRWLTRRAPRTTVGLRPVGVLTTPPPEPDPEPVPEPEPEPEQPALRRGVEEALRLLDEEREPGDAVMEAWLGLQQTAEDSGVVRRAAETPTEFTSRIMGRVFTDDRAIQTLLTLYLRCRFGDHPVTATDVARAREALAGLVRSWNRGVDS